MKKTLTLLAAAAAFLTSMPMAHAGPIAIVAARPAPAAVRVAPTPAVTAKPQSSKTPIATTQAVPSAAMPVIVSRPATGSSKTNCGDKARAKEDCNAK